MPEKEYDHIAQSASDLWQEYKFERWKRIKTGYTVKRYYKNGEFFVSAEKMQGRAMGISVAEDYDKEYNPSYHQHRTQILETVI
jgi:hypothetical protein